MTQLTLATFNTHHGKDKMAPYSFKAFVESVESLDADILCLQELDVYALRTRFARQPRRLAKALGYYYAGSRVRFFGAGYQYNAILSRTPIIAQREVTLPRERGQQVRKALTVDIEHDIHPFTVTTTHLHSHGAIKHKNHTAEKQLDFLLNRCSAHERCLIAGDFNLLPRDVEEIAMRYGYLSPHPYPTSPTNIPKNQIDWIIGRNVYIGSVRTSDHLTSDHRALIATVADVAI